VILTTINNDGYNTISKGYTFDYTPTPTPAQDVLKSEEIVKTMDKSDSTDPLPVPPSQTARISVESSEKYLQWGFVSSTADALPPLDIYLDDSAIPVITNYTLGTYLQSGLTSGERHTITLYNSTARIVNASEPQLIAKATAKTTTADWSLYFLICVGILLLILLIVLNELVIIIMLGIFAIIIDLIGMGISGSYGFIGSIFLGLAIITGIVLLIKALPKLQDAISWM
jgi:ABC-type antimicrobial peptide transport system permease subunit